MYKSLSRIIKNLSKENPKLDATQFDDVKKVHENVILKFIALQNSASNKDVITLGVELLDLDCDDLTDGGFWIWHIGGRDEFYSPKFRKVLGFKGENDFPSVSDSWQKQISEEDLGIAFKKFGDTLSSGKDLYYQVINYKKKDEGELLVLCSGTIIKNKEGKPIMLIGTHKIIK